jgi:hypothetical protein
MRIKIAGTMVLVALLVHSSALADGWSNRAEAALTKILRSDSAGAIASSVQRITHPSGSNGVVSAFFITKEKDALPYLSALITVKWTGEFGGYRTIVVEWVFDRHGSRQAYITMDDAPIKTSKDNTRRLDDYFRGPVYNMLMVTMGN